MNATQLSLDLFGLGIVNLDDPIPRKELDAAIGKLDAELRPYTDDIRASEQITNADLRQIIR